LKQLVWCLQAVKPAVGLLLLFGLGEADDDFRNKWVICI
jgi:hypothetical protein